MVVSLSKFKVEANIEYEIEVCFPKGEREREIASNEILLTHFFPFLSNPCIEVNGD